MPFTPKQALAALNVFIAEMKRAAALTGFEVLSWQNLMILESALKRHVDLAAFGERLDGILATGKAHAPH